jgi:predicted MFS family arabinose efflux permease
MRLPPKIQAEKKSSPLGDLKAGLRYLLTQPSILTILLLITCTSLFGISFMTLIPAWAVNMLEGDAATNGFLQSARGLGAMIAALTIASLGRFKFRGRLLSLGMLCLPLLLFAFAFTRLLSLSLLLLVFLGSALILINNIAMSLVQTLVDEKLRGRVMGIYSLNFFGFSSLGSLLVGGLAQGMGAFATLLCCSLLILVIFLVIWLIFPKLRQLE